MTTGFQPGSAPSSSPAGLTSGSNFAKAGDQAIAQLTGENRLDGIHIWRVDLDCQPRQTLTATLSPDEKQRAASIRDPAARNRWINSRAALRRILGHHARRKADEIRFEYGPYGKPRLPRAKGRRQSIYFNMTRSADLCLVAVSRDRPVGIDVARLTGGDRIDHIARQFFSIQEAAAIRSVSGDGHHLAFLNAWTRREAYAKAIGVGLPLALRGIRVSVDDCRPPAIVALEHDDPAKWRLIALRPAEGYVGALAVRDGGMKGQSAIRTEVFAFAAESDASAPQLADAIVAA